MAQESRRTVNSQHCIFLPFIAENFLRCTVLRFVGQSCLPVRCIAIPAPLVYCMTPFFCLNFPFSDNTITTRQPGLIKLSWAHQTCRSCLYDVLNKSCYFHVLNSLRHLGKLSSFIFFGLNFKISKNGHR